MKTMNLLWPGVKIENGGCAEAAVFVHCADAAVFGGASWAVGIFSSSM